MVESSLRSDRQFVCDRLPIENLSSANANSHVHREHTREEVGPREVAGNAVALQSGQATNDNNSNSTDKTTFFFKVRGQAAVVQVCDLLHGKTTSNLPGDVLSEQENVNMSFPVRRIAITLHKMRLALAPSLFFSNSSGHALK